MKKSYQALLAATLGCALALPVLAADPAPAATEKASAELKAVLTQHHEALNKQDIKTFVNTAHHCGKDTHNTLLPNFPRSGNTFGP